MTTTDKLPSLKAMAEGKIEGIQKATIFKVDPDVVEFEEGFNLREEGPELDAHLERLYVSMKAGAFIPPIDVIVIDGRVIARDGHCRTRVARRLKSEGVPYLLEARQFRGNEVDSVLHMIGSGQGKSFTPLEQGRGFLRLLNYGLTIQQIADRLGMHRSTIDIGLALAEAPLQIQQMISRGEVSTQVALEAMKKYGSKAAEHLTALVEKAKGNGVARVTKKHVSPRVPQRVALTFVSTTTALRDFLGNPGPSDVELFRDDDMIKVPGKVIKELLAAQAEAKGDQE